MRKAFIGYLTNAAKKNKDIYLLTADLGFSVFEGFRERFPDRFINVGVAEANMAGVAAGLALCAKTVFIYSIAPFVTLRCFEQVRNDICYQHLKVCLIGVGGGFSYGSAGMTHFALEDIAVMRTLSNMTVVCPADAEETKAALTGFLRQKGPFYLRIGKGNDPVVHDRAFKFTIGKGCILQEGRALTIIATGGMVSTALAVARKLSKQGKGVRLISMHTIKPIDKELILSSAQITKAIFTIEEHGLIGGLGSAVAEVLAESCSKKILFKRIAYTANAPMAAGSQDYLKKRFALDEESITSRILRSIKEKK